MRYWPLALGLVLLAAGGLWLLGRHGIAPPFPPPPEPRDDAFVTPSAATPTNDQVSTTTVPSRSPHISGEVVFNLADMVPGDRYGDFTIVKAFYNPPSASYPDPVYGVQFEGTATFRGVFNRGGDICGPYIQDIATSSAQALPRPSVRIRPTNSFMLTSDGTLDDADIHDGDQIEVTIKGFDSAAVPKDCGGDSGFVTQLKKVGE